MLLLNAFTELNDPRAYLLLVGNGELEDKLKEKANDLDPSTRSRIFFMDFQNQMTMPGVYKTADVLVLPSKGPGETWGLSVNEAMACSRAVIVSDRCGCSVDLVRDRVNGFVFPGNNVGDLVNKMKILLTDRNNIRRMGEASKKMISEWSFTHICLAIEEGVYAPA